MRLSPGITLLLLLCIPLGCCSPTPGEPDDIGDTNPDGVDVPDQVEDIQDDFSVADLKASYGVIETIAGKGTIPTNGVNGWLPEYEGGLAVDAELSRPHMAMSDVQGNIYIADKDAHAVRRVDPGGVITTVAGTGQPGDDGDVARPGVSSRLSSPNGLYVTEQAVFIYDLGNDKVRRLGADGVLQTVFRTGGSGDGRGLWVSADENEIWIAAGTELKRWRRGEGVEVVASGFVSLGNLDQSPQGWMGVTDRGAHTVYRVEQDGSRSVIAGNGQTSGGGPGALATAIGLDEVRGIYFHPRAGYFLATHKGGQIWYVDQHDRIYLFVDGDSSDVHAGDGEPFDSPGEKISEPRAVVMAPNGDVLITEHDAGYVRRVRYVGE